MPFDGNGNYTVPAGTQAVSGQIIDSIKYNALLTDLQTALTKAFLRDGQSAALTNLPMGGFKLTGLAAGVSANDSVRMADLAGAHVALADVATTSTTSTTATTATNINVTDDNATNANLFPVFVTGSGNVPSKLSSINLKFNPAIGTLTAVAFSGNGNSLSGSAGALSIGGSAGSAPWSGITGKPTTVAGYGITDFESRIGAIAAGGVGSTGLFSYAGGPQLTAGSTTAGSTLIFCDTTGSNLTVLASGTWVCCGFGAATGSNSVFRRIS